MEEEGVFIYADQAVEGREVDPRGLAFERAQSFERQRPFETAQGRFEPLGGAAQFVLRLGIFAIPRAAQH